MNWLFIVLMGSLLLPSAASSAPKDNLLPNPGFEAGMGSRGAPVGWKIGRGSPAMTSATPQEAARTGKAGLSIRSTSPKTWCYVSCPGIPIASEDEIRFDVFYRTKLTKSKENSARMTLIIRSAEGAILLNKATPLEPATNWTAFTQTITAPAGAATAEVQFNLAQALGEVQFDDASFVITSPYSMTIESPEPYAGAQMLKVGITNRTGSPLEGKLRLTVAGAKADTFCRLSGARRDEFLVPAYFAKEGNHDYALELLGSSGTAVRKLSGRFTIPAPFRLLVACPQYHCTGEGNGQTEVCAEVNLEPVARIAAQLKLSLLDAKGRELRRQEIHGIHDRYTTCTVSVPIRTPGSYLIRAELTVPGTTTRFVSETDVHVIRRSEARVTVGPDGCLRVKGKPVFPVGMYQASQMGEMARAGFNATHSYGAEKHPLVGKPPFEIPATKQFLDNSYANGMGAMLGLFRETIERGDWDAIRRRILTFRNHPGLLCWGEEEGVARGCYDRKTLDKLAKMVRELDPNHPFLVGDSYDMSYKVDFAHIFPEESLDIAIWWWYPIPLDPDPDAARPEYAGPGGLEMKYPEWLDQISIRKPYWAAVQTYAKGNPVTFPTPDQRRCNTYLAIIKGAKGIWFYTGSGEMAADGKPGGIFNRPKEGNWEELKAFAGELRELQPVLTAPDSQRKIRVECAEGTVLFRVKNLRGKPFIIAANRGPKPVKARFIGRGLRGTATVRFENRTLPIAAGTFEDGFVPYGTHVYEINR